jgi:4-hydroxy-tetrahydrodipicolinate reductase
MRYALVGCGRMGRAIEVEAGRRGHVKVAEIDSSSAGLLAREGLSAAHLGSPDVAFEFTLPEAAPANVRALLGAGVAVVCGTTGFEVTPGLRQELERARCAVVLSANFSVGMALFRGIVREAGRRVAAAALHRPWILEAHHVGKADAPSGTARELARILLEVDPRMARVHEGNPRGKLADDALQVLSLRAGAEPGTHTVGFDGEFDRITLSHAARSRSGFAIGAVLAAEWTRGRTGLHEFDEVLEAILDAASRSAPGAGGGEPT